MSNTADKIRSLEDQIDVTESEGQDASDEIYELEKYLFKRSLHIAALIEAAEVAYSDYHNRCSNDCPYRRLKLALDALEETK